MTMLDCHNSTSAHRTISSILGLSLEELHAVVVSFRIDNDSSGPWTDDLLAHVLTKAERVRHSGTYYFHLTRTQRPEAFYTGIEPLGHVLDRLWDSLGSLASPDIGRQDWTTFRGWLEIPGNGGDSGDLYRMKAEDSFHWGPYGALLRESAFQSAELGQHDYLAVPEIIEDICNAVGEEFGLDLLERFVASSTPCIVKFATKDTETETLKTAVAYLWGVLLDEPTLSGNYSHDAAGPVPRDRVVAVETLR
jgi:hypothetical protein